MFLKITVPGIFLKSKIFSYYNTKNRYYTMYYTFADYN